MAAYSNRAQILFLLSHLNASRRRRTVIYSILLKLLNKCVISRRQLMGIVTAYISSTTIDRKIRRLARNCGWLNHLIKNATDVQFRKAMRISKGTFTYIVEQIGPALVRATVTENPIPPEERVAVGLYRLARGDYFYTIAEMCSLGASTVAEISHEFNRLLISILWERHVTSLAPTNEDHLREKIVEMEEAWQFPCAWAAVDGCHIPIKSPMGGAEAKKEYYNFKNFYSIILMAMVDAKYRFVWASCGYPGNSNDSVIYQSTDMYSKLAERPLFPETNMVINGETVEPLVLADSAFQLKNWIMKPYTNATTSDRQAYFNYRLSRARMVVKCAFGQMKGRWRGTLRKNESPPSRVKFAVLASVLLHNICLENGETMFRKFDLTIDPVTNERRRREEILSTVTMTQRSRASGDERNTSAVRVRDVLKETFWNEHRVDGRP